MNFTQLTGLVMFGLATVCAVRTASLLRSRVWWWMAAASLAFTLEVAFGWRHQLHALVTSILMPLGIYGERRPLQVLLLTCLVLALVVPLSIRVRSVWRSDRRAGAAAMACTAVLFLFLAESISLHAIDAIMYTGLGPVALVGLLWAILAAVTACMALSAAAARVPRMWARPRTRSAGR